MMTVDVVVLKPASIARTITIPGTILPSEQVDVFSEVAGRVQSINFSEGQSVQKGKTILQVDSDILKAQRAQATVELDLAKKDEARKQTLLNSKGISLQEYEVSASNLASAQAKLDLLNVQISKANIKAPFSGKVGLRHVSEGAFINTSTLITTIIQESKVKIEFAVPEKYTQHVKKGQSISFQADGINKTFNANVYAFEPRIDQGTRMMTVRAELSNSANLIAGSFVSIEYDMGKEENAFMVPTESIIPVLNGQKVYVVRKGTVIEVPVQMGLRTEDDVQVIGELQKGDEVLISGLLAVRPGMPVKTKINSK
jgi:membrane fusion protein (multidrug efflux system)